MIDEKANYYDKAMETYAYIIDEQKSNKLFGYIRDLMANQNMAGQRESKLYKKRITLVGFLKYPVNIKLKI